MLLLDIDVSNNIIELVWHNNKIRFNIRARIGDIGTEMYRFY